MNNKLIILFYFFFLNFSFGQSWTQVSDFPLNAAFSGFGYEHEGKGYWLAPVDDNYDQFEPGPYPLNYKLFEYDPVTDIWSELPNEGFPELNLEMGYWYNDKVYFGYGFKDLEPTPSILDDKIYSFDPSDGSYTELSTCPGGGRVQGALVVHNDVVYSGSGFKIGDFSQNDNWWAYDLNTGVWAQKSSLPDGDLHQTMEFVVGDFIYVMGSHESYSWYKYDINNDSWTTINDELGARHASGVQKYNGKVYFYGGDIDAHDNPMPQDEFFMEYDPVMDTWTELPSIPGDTRRFGPGTFIIDDKLYVVSGALKFFFTDETTWYFDMTQLGTTPVNETLAAKELEVSPNPVSDYLTLDNIDLTGVYSVIIRDLSGKQVYSGKLSTNNINLSDFAAGTYIINVYSDKEVYLQKIVKL